MERASRGVGVGVGMGVGEGEGMIVGEGMGEGCGDDAALLVLVGEESGRCSMTANVLISRKVMRHTRSTISVSRCISCAEACILRVRTTTINTGVTSMRMAASTCQIGSRS